MNENEELNEDLFEDGEIVEDDVEVGQEPTSDNGDDENEEDELLFDEENEAEGDENNNGDDDDVDEPLEQAEKEQPQPAEEKKEPVIKQEPKTERQKLVEAVSNQLNSDEIPTTREFRAKVIAEAKAAVCKELGLESEDDYNSFDEEHTYLLSEKIEEIRNQKKQHFDATVNRIKGEIEAEARKEKTESLIRSICDTPDKLANLDKIIRNSVSLGYFESMQKDIAKGNYDKLIKVANLAAGKKNVTVAKTAKQNNGKPTKTKRDRGLYASDYVFG